MGQGQVLPCVDEVVQDSAKVLAETVENFGPRGEREVGGVDVTLDNRYLMNPNNPSGCLKCIWQCNNYYFI